MILNLPLVRAREYLNEICRFYGKPMEREFPESPDLRKALQTAIANNIDNLNERIRK